MSTSNYPTTTYERDQQPRKNGKTVIIVVLAIAFVATWGYLLAHNNTTEKVIDQNTTQIAKVTDEKSTVRKNFDEALARLDSMSGISASLKGKLAESNKQVAAKKAEIRRILNKANASKEELAKAQQMINELNDKITNMEQDVARLTQANEGLKQDNQTLTVEKASLDSNLTATTVVKQDLEKKVDVASTLNASNITITPIDVKGNGKEKVTTTAKRVDKLVVSFDVSNLIAETGTTDVYVCITGPDGKNLTMPENTSGTETSGTFTTREEGDKAFTAKVPVEIETAKKKNVQFAFQPGAHLQQGSYTIQIYQNGFKIGEGTRALKKGGLFS
jgi:hypothetical protein